MGTELLEDSEISELCDECASAAGVDLRRLLTTADDDELRLTQNAQPAVCFAGLALALLLRRRRFNRRGGGTLGRRVRGTGDRGVGHGRRK